MKDQQIKICKNTRNNMWLGVQRTTVSAMKVKEFWNFWAGPEKCCRLSSVQKFIINLVKFV